MSLSMLIFVSCSVVFCWINDVSYNYTSEQWCLIYEQWAEHNDRSYVPDLPFYEPFVDLTPPDGVILPEGHVGVFKRPINGEFGYVAGRWIGNDFEGRYYGPMPPREWIHDLSVKQTYRMCMYLAREYALHKGSDLE